MKIRNAMFGAALALVVPAAAMAQAPTLYVGGAGGYNMQEDATLSRAFNPSLTAQFDDGWAASGTVGVAFASGLRLEGEYAFRTNDVSSIGGAAAGGTVTSHALMMNALYDFNFGWPVTPFLGVGAGGARVDYDGVSRPGLAIDNGDLRFAYQGIAGLTYNISPSLKLDVDYKYFATMDPRVQTSAGRADTEYKNHSIFVGLRYMFGPTPVVAAAAPAPTPAPAPPPPAPAPQITRNFLVFFDWDKSDITPEASRILQQAAAAAKAGNIARINVTGHTDTSGATVYNQRLSERRAEAVKGALVQLGLPASGIVTLGRGESQLLVPTADGVREPQNRRAEIVLQ